MRAEILKVLTEKFDLYTTCHIRLKNKAGNPDQVSFENVTLAMVIFINSWLQSEGCIIEQIVLNK